MSVKDKLIRARSRILQSYSFYASSLLRLDLKEMSEEMMAYMPTMATDGASIYYCPEFIEKIPLDELMGVFIHEVLHVICLHPLRRGERDQKLWNMACDYSINHIITDAGISLSAGVLHDVKYKGMFSEEIYDKLKKEAEKKAEKKAKTGGSSDDSKKDGDKWNIGGVLDHPLVDEDGNPVSKEEAEKRIKQIVTQAVESFKAAGNISAELKKMIDEIVEPKLCWKELLARFITQMSRNDYSWSRRNKRYSGNILMPVLQNPEIGRLVFIGDTSGSTGIEEWKEFTAEMFGVLHTFGMDSVFTIYADCAVAGTEWLEEGMTPTISGGGGTDFIPAFKYLEDNESEEDEPVCVIYLTDGYCSSFPEEPEYPVLWVISKNGDKNFSPPFGEVAHL